MNEIRYVHAPTAYTVHTYMLLYTYILHTYTLHTYINTAYNRDT